MDKKKWVLILVAFGAGVVLSDKVRTFPVLSKLPTL